MRGGITWGRRSTWVAARSLDTETAQHGARRRKGWGLTTGVKTTVKTTVKTWPLGTAGKRQNLAGGRRAAPPGVYHVVISPPMLASLT